MSSDDIPLGSAFTRPIPAHEAPPLSSTLDRFEAVRVGERVSLRPIPTDKKRTLDQWIGDMKRMQEQPSDGFLERALRPHIEGLLQWADSLPRLPAGYHYRFDSMPTSLPIDFDRDEYILQFVAIVVHTQTGLDAETYLKEFSA